MLFLKIPIIMRSSFHSFYFWILYSFYIFLFLINTLLFLSITLLFNCFCFIWWFLLFLRGLNFFYIISLIQALSNQLKTNLLLLLIFMVNFFWEVALLIFVFTQIDIHLSNKYSFSSLFSRVKSNYECLKIFSNNIFINAKNQKSNLGSHLHIHFFFS